MILLGFVSAIILCLGLAKMFGFFPADDNQLTENNDENIPGTPVSTSEEEGYEDDRHNFEENEIKQETKTETKTETKDLRTIIENYEP